MRSLSSFTHVSLDGYYADRKGEMNWAHQGSDDPEWSQFVAGNATGGGTLVFGRITYEMMASYWPTPMALKANPVVAERMNAMPKIVFSRRLDKVSWQNTTLVKGDMIAAVTNLKREPGPDMAILGSGSIVAQLAAAGSIDGMQLAINPIVLGSGKALFAGLAAPLPLTLVSSRAFANGKVVLSYRPAA